jgi:hypothetical protein
VPGSGQTTSNSASATETGNGRTAHGLGVVPIAFQAVIAYQPAVNTLDATDPARASTTGTAQALAEEFQLSLPSWPAGLLGPEMGAVGTGPAVDVLLDLALPNRADRPSSNGSWRRSIGRRVWPIPTARWRPGARRLGPIPTPARAACGWFHPFSGRAAKGVIWPLPQAGPDGRAYLVTAGIAGQP